GVARHAAGEHGVDIGRGALHTAARVDAKAQRARVVQAAAAGGGADGGVVFAPIAAAVVPGYPDAAFTIYGDRGVKLGCGLGGDGDSAGELPAVEGAEEDVVISGVVGIPGDPGDAALVERYGGLPVVGVAGGDARLRTPTLAAEAARVDIGVATTEGLPDDGYVSGGIRDGTGVEIAHRSVR